MTGVPAQMSHEFEKKKKLRSSAAQEILLPVFIASEQNICIIQIIWHEDLSEFLKESKPLNFLMWFDDR